jgi:hypothetical protein
MDVDHPPLIQAPDRAFVSTFFRDSADVGKEGPVGLQLHGCKAAREVQYKDVVIEAFLKGNRLITVEP